jgi:hypothetical protein
MAEIVVLVMPSDDRVWLDSATVIEWLRSAERRHGERLSAAEGTREAIEVLAGGEVLRQVREHLTLTQMQGAMAREARRGSD